MSKTHSFHIPVMGIGYTIDTPLKVSHLGIDSVISLVDDIILEKLRKMYCDKFEIPYLEITEKIEDFRAKRITSYLNLINNLAGKKFEEFKTASTEKAQELKDYFSMLPDSSAIKQEFTKMTSNYFNFNEVGNWIKDKLSMGSIDVNIMTKVDKDNFRNGEQLPTEYNDAHAALRGYANSDLSSSVILSAGMNPRLYSYIEKFDDFFPNVKGKIKKKIVLKVSDYRSALIQGKFLAKKGLWVSEYRIESGLNCGGHAFASEGYLMGPILSEFKEKREEMLQTLSETVNNALELKGKIIPEERLHIKITAQGGVGDAEEHQFLLDHYQVDSVGWGSPFLLVPEAVNIDDPTLTMLKDAKEEDLFLSNISPLGIPFNSLKGNTKDVEKESLIAKGRPGSSCPKKFVALSKEFSDKGMCTASREYQYNKLKELDKRQLTLKHHKFEYDKIVEKSCTCVGLGTSALLVNNLDTKVEGDGVSICPGPNMAYFSKTMKLKEIIDHIYGRTGEFVENNRPNMFIKEFNIYIDYLKEKMNEASFSMTKKQEKYLVNFLNNMEEGANYYTKLFKEIKDKFEVKKSTMLQEIDEGLSTLQLLKLDLAKLSPIKV